MGANLIALVLSAAVLQTPHPDSAAPLSSPAVPLFEPALAGVPDAAERWPGRRHQGHPPSGVGLGRDGGGPDSLPSGADPADPRRPREAEIRLARLSDTLPDPVTGVRVRGLAYERVSDALRYDRVQGLSLGLGYRVRAPAVRSADLQATMRYGFSDDRVTGRLALVRDAPGGRLVLAGYRDVVDADPVSSGRTLGNTLNALFVAHDDADYLLAEGGAATFETSLRSGLDLVLAGRVERETGVRREAKSAVNDALGGDGIFPPNAPAEPGTFGGGSVGLAHTGGIRWDLTADVLGGGGRATGRLFGNLRVDAGQAAGASLRVKAGIATSPTRPQSLFRLGGQATVRGFDYGSGRGQAFWAAQLDVTPVGGRLRPVAFVDAGQAERPGDLFSSPVLAGGGVGLSVFGGVLRLDLSHPITPDGGGKVRFDIVVQAPR
jgi:hypothetical protein